MASASRDKRLEGSRDKQKEGRAWYYLGAIYAGGKEYDKALSELDRSDDQAVNYVKSVRNGIGTEVLSFMRAESQPLQASLIQQVRRIMVPISPWSLNCKYSYRTRNR